MPARPTDSNVPVGLDRLKIAIESVPVVVKLLSPDWIIEYVNPMVTEVLGYRPEELIGQPISLIREANSEVERELTQALRAGDTWSGDRLDRHRDGHTVPVRLVVAPVRGADGELTGIVEIARDLTQEIEHESRAKEVYRMSVVGHLAAAVAHEVNNPLAAIVMMTRVLLDGDLPDELRRDLEIINAEAHRAGGISRNLLAFSRHADTQKTATDLEAIVREVSRLKLPELRLSEIEIDIVMPARLPCALANAGQMRQIFHNLISNAAQAIQEHRDGGLIRITARAAEPGWLEVTVDDEGAGIPEHILQRVMTPFFTTKPIGRGTGLGLSVSRDIVEDHGGELSIGNRPAAEGGGARVTIRLPTTEARAATPTRTVSELAGGGNHRGRVLIVDDDAAVAATLQRLVQRLGYVGQVEHRAEAAIERIVAGETFDAILTDLKMPGVGGAGLLRAVEANRPDLLARVVFMSGDISPEVSFIAGAACQTLAKPFTRDQLQDALEAVSKADS